MLQQMAPVAPIEREEDEPDEIKVSHTLNVTLIGRSSMRRALTPNYLNSSANLVVHTFLPPILRIPL